MGGTAFNRKKGQKLSDIFAVEFAAPDTTMVAHATVGKAFYAVMEAPAATVKALVADETGRTRYLMVVETSTAAGYYNFGYKDMTEFMGPKLATCPDKLLDMLSPIKDEDNHYTQGARGFRAASRHYNAIQRAMVLGAEFTLPKAVRFSDGVTAERFLVVAMKGKRPVFARINDRRAVSLSSYLIGDLQVAA